MMIRRGFPGRAPSPTAAPRRALRAALIGTVALALTVGAAAPAEGTSAAASPPADTAGALSAAPVRTEAAGGGSIADPLPDPGLQSLISGAIESGQDSLTIEPGTYAVGPTDGSFGKLLTIDGADGLTIEAAGVTIVGTELTRALDIRNSTDLTINGLTITYDPLPFTQGEVTQIAADLGWIDVRLDEGYPQVAYSRVSIYDPQTGFQKAGINHLWGTTAAFVAPGVVRVTLGGIGTNVAVGDPITLAGGPTGEAHAISMEESGGTVLRDVTAHTAPGFGLIDTSGDGGTLLERFRLTPGSPPPGATRAPLLSAVWDGLQFQSLGTGPTMIDSEIRNAGDDSFSIQTRALPVLAADGDRIIVGFPDRWKAASLEIGDRLAQFRGDPDVHVTAIAQVDYAAAAIAPEIRAKVEQAQSEGWNPWNLDKTSVYELTLDATDAFTAADFVFNPDRMGNDFVFKDNVVRSPGRGILLKAGNGIIEGNTFEGGDKAIMIATENEADSHGGTAYDLTIRDNVFRGTGYHHDMPWSDQAGSVGMAGKNVVSRRAYSNILIEDNLFESIRGLNLNVSNAEDVTVRGNVFRDTHRSDTGGTGANGASFGIPADAVAYVAESDRVVFEGNTVEGIGPFGNAALVVSPTADVTGAETMTDAVPSVSVKSGAEFTVATGGTYDRVSFKLHSPRKIDRVVLNGVTKDLTDNAWSDVNFVKPGTFGAVKGRNTLVVHDTQGGTRTIVFTLN
ncbi:right-handed parallel beta-helix repeat-containing protein [Microbacterium sp. 179-I 3D2 NHS]|uniref:right-handed parallel beta-helix repeat-containing protein n=1 Tax=Microbacterium sp. 179-I 3D2 NHS TaxID=3235178 RepID=UPI0039A3EBF9